MKNINDLRLSPFNFHIGFSKLLEYYERQLESKNLYIVENAKRILKIADEFPQLREGISDLAAINLHKAPIDNIFNDVFKDMLSDNEIKMVTLPFHNLKFYATRRFHNILKHAGEGFSLSINNLSDNEYYIVGCTVIIKALYGYDARYKRPYTYQIPDSDGILKHYKILYNADFVKITATEHAPEITEEVFNQLLDNFHNIDLWKEKFPPQSYNFEGFVIANIFEVTDDQSISNIKTTLIADGKRKDEAFIKNFKEVFQSLFSISDLEVGFSIYNEADNTFQKIYGEGIKSYLLKEEENQKCYNVLCERSFDAIVNKKQVYSISDIEKFNALAKGKSPQYKTLLEQGYKSAILAPIANDNVLLGVLELVSKSPKVLNSINATKLKDVMPFIVSSVKRSKREQENLVEAIIQQECTSIHPSVKWKFDKAALKFIEDTYKNKKEAQFAEIVIKDVYPLFGQIDVQGSSNARNIATKKDLLLQLNLLTKLMSHIIESEKLPYYEQVAYQLKKLQDDIKADFRVDSEQQIYDFITKDVNPILLAQSKKHKSLETEIDKYFQKIDSSLNFIYFYRKNYDDTIAMINQNMSSYLDQMQPLAQSYYPHYFERYKTDGVEHNMYIGNSITKEDDFDLVYLYNLRLWQLQVMCEMENAFYHNQHQYPISLEVASMILVFSQPLSIRFRMDEKQFDVDGTYNARYEVVKKRIDKAHIKGTTKRITQSGKITIVYSQKEDEIEYLRYIDFLSSKNILSGEVEILELQDLQGVTGLKALRVSLLYHKDNEKNFYTYNDLISEIKA